MLLRSSNSKLSSWVVWAFEWWTLLGENGWTITKVIHVSGLVPPRERLFPRLQLSSVTENFVAVLKFSWGCESFIILPKFVLESNWFGKLPLILVEFASPGPRLPSDNAWFCHEWRTSRKNKDTPLAPPILGNWQRLDWWRSQYRIKGSDSDHKKLFNPYIVTELPHQNTLKRVHQQLQNARYLRQIDSD